MVRTVVVKPVVPSSAKVPCADPVLLPDRAINQAEATIYWGRDRTALKQCEARRSAAIAAAQ